MYALVLTEHELNLKRVPRPEKIALCEDSKLLMHWINFYPFRVFIFANIFNEILI